MRKIAYFIVLLSLLSCSSEKPADTQKAQGTEGEGTSAQQTAAPHQSERTSSTLKLFPLDAIRTSTLMLYPEGFSLSDATIEWLVNGKAVASDRSIEFKATNTKKGDVIQAKATVAGKELFSNIVKVSNTPPEISLIKFMPETLKAGDSMYVDVTGSDADGDEVTMLHEWTKNGESAGNDKQIPLPLKRGDKISIKITPFDGAAYGKPTILHREIKNMPPIIIDDRKAIFDGKTYKYQVKATDPDEDPLTYSLITSPQGMTINPGTGLIQWNLTADFTGKAICTVSVTDGHGGKAVQEIIINITPEKAK